MRELIKTHSLIGNKTTSGRLDLGFPSLTFIQRESEQLHCEIGSTFMRYF